MSKPCFDAWVALGQLVAHIWKPTIPNLTDYLDTVDILVHNFLAKTAQWSPNWFSKPKFHILVHLRAHILRFGPAILFATEVFESFNAVIRNKSIHSNRQAPSHDIAVAFAQCNRVRHLLSGAYFRRAAAAPEILQKFGVPQSTNTVNAQEAGIWVEVAAAPKVLLADPASSTVLGYLGLDTAVIDNSKCQYLPNSTTQPFSATESYQLKIAGIPDQMPVRQCRSYAISDSSRCSRGSWVLTSAVGVDGRPSAVPAQVIEILQHETGTNSVRHPPDIVLLHLAHIPALLPHYNLPKVQLRDASLPESKCLVRPTAILCTINVQHNCYEHNCSVSGTRSIRFEGVADQRELAVVVHKNPEDIMLNTLKMRDANAIALATPPISKVDMAQAIHSGVQDLIDRRKAAAQQAQTADDAANSGGEQGRGTGGRGRGRGRGRAHGRGRGRGRATAHSLSQSMDAPTDP